MAQVYQIACTVNDMRYVGCTKKGEKALKKRFREHRCLLRNGTHAEKRFLADWHEFGEAAFSISPLEHLPEDCGIADKRTAEKRWMAVFSAKGFLYNTNLMSFEGNPETLAKRVEAARIANTGRVHSPEERLKRSLNNKGKHTGHGAKISATKKALGQQPSRECIEKSICNRQLRAAGKLPPLENA